VLANEDVLAAGEYPVSLRVRGPSGVAWEKHVTLRIPKPPPGEDGSLAVEVFSGQVTLNGPPGEYEFAASMDRGGAPFGGRLKFRMRIAFVVPVTGSSRKPRTGPLQATLPVRLWGVGRAVETWLKKQGVRCSPFEGNASSRGEVILVGKVPGRDRLGGDGKANGLGEAARCSCR